MSDFLGPRPLTPAGLDAATADKINTPGSATKAALNATFAAIRTPVDVVATKYGDELARFTSPTLVAIGDSITDNNHVSTPWTGASASRTSAYRADGYLTRALIQSRQPVTVFDVGISGNTTTQMLARFDADVLTLKPRIVLEAGGTNDVRQGFAAATTIANKLAMYERSFKAGAAVIATTVPPSADSTGAQRQVAAEINTWLRGFARNNTQNFALVDWHPDLGDPLTGGVKAALMDAPGVHPNTLGAYTVAPKFVAAIKRFVPVTVDFLPTDNVTDKAILINNPMFTGATGGKQAGVTGPVGDGWFAGLPAGASATITQVARADGFGNWQQVTTGAGTKVELLQDGRAGSWAVGDVIRAAVEFETDASGWTDGSLSLNLQCVAGATVLHLGVGQSSSSEPSVQGRDATGVLVTPPITIPTGTTAIRLVASKGQAGTIRWGRAAIHKLPA